MKLDVLIEGLLFYKAVPQKKSTLLKLFDVQEDDFAGALAQLRTRLESGATRLIETDTHISLATAPELSDLITTIRREDLSTDIGKAGAETLAIVLYREPVTRAEIDHIRGVNSSFILRNLQTRGLITRKAVKNSYSYSTTPDLLQQLGITHKQELPRFAEFMNTIDDYATNSPTV